jgi:hypothetical protein
LRSARKRSSAALLTPHMAVARGAQHSSARIAYCLSSNCAPRAVDFERLRFALKHSAWPPTGLRHWCLHLISN